MQQIETMLDRALKNTGQERLAAITELKHCALDDPSRHGAVQALITLWQHGYATPTDLAPHTATIKELWREVFERVMPFQQLPVKVEWLMDDEYAPASSEAECLLALLGYLPDPEIGPDLRNALAELTDPSLGMLAAVSLLRRHEAVSPLEIESIASSHLVRIYLWEYLKELSMESLMPPKWATSDGLAASALTRWLQHPNELGTVPEEVELMAIFPIEFEEGSTEDAYLFRFCEYPKPWEPGEGWMAGIAGPYRDGRPLESPWSSFKRWDSLSPEEHFDTLYYRHGKNNCERL